MTEISISYGIVLYELGVDEESIAQSEEIFQEVSEVADILTNPTISLDIKHIIIEKVFPREMVHFLKKMCDNHQIVNHKEIFEAYHDYSNKKRNILRATLYYVTKPREGQKERIEKFLCRKFGGSEVELTMVQSPELIGGFIIRMGSREYDWSIRGRMQQLEINMKRGERVEFN